MSVNPITAAISDYRAQEIAAKAAGNTALAFELGNMIVGLESLATAHEARVAPLTAPAHTYFVVRETRGGAARIGKSHTDRHAAEELASEMWAKEDMGFLHLPCYRVVRDDDVVVSDPIDCYPGEA